MRPRARHHGWHVLRPPEPGWEDVLLAAYGVAPDPARTRYYRLLYDLGP
jgi:aminoglycoside phosphotransferase